MPFSSGQSVHCTDFVISASEHRLWRFPESVVYTDFIYISVRALFVPFSSFSVADVVCTDFACISVRGLFVSIFVILGCRASLAAL